MSDVGSRSRASKARAKKQRVMKAAAQQRAKRVKLLATEPAKEVENEVAAGNAGGSLSSRQRDGQLAGGDTHPVHALNFQRITRATPPEAARVLFDEWRDLAKAFVDERCAVAGAAPYATKGGFQRRFAYVLINYLVKVGHQCVFEASLKNAKRPVPRGDAVQRTAYRIGLSALYGNVPQDELRYMAYQLEYARRHLIPAELLIGFLRQTGPTAQFAVKVKSNAREAWFTSLRWPSDGEIHAKLRLEASGIR